MVAEGFQEQSPQLSKRLLLFLSALVIFILILACQLFLNASPSHMGNLSQLFPLPILSSQPLRALNSKQGGPNASSGRPPEEMQDLGGPSKDEQVQAAADIPHSSDSNPIEVEKSSKSEQGVETSSKRTPLEPHEFTGPSPGTGWPPQNELVRQILSFNENGPWRNVKASPKITPDMVPIVIYVHKRPAYLREVLRRLSEVEGIEETVLMISHDGVILEMVDVVKEFTFLPIKQVFVPYSPHNYVDSFPNKGPEDCYPKESDFAEHQPDNCTGDRDQYGSYRDPFFVGLKHHWFWLMNSVWEMEELRNFDGHIMFMEEDHLVVPNAYRTLQTLISVRNARCPKCIAVSLSTGNRGHHEGQLDGKFFGADRLSNMAYAFNRTLWQRVREQAQDFCRFDEYGWDWSLECAILEKWGPNRLSLHPAGASVIHAGNCGLHFNRNLNLNASECGMNSPEVVSFLKRQADRPAPSPEWPMRYFLQDSQRACNYTGYGGFADRRDQRLCLHFAGVEVDS